MTKTKTIALVLTALATAGCAGLQPKSGVAPTGEPLSIESWTASRKETVSEKVGETEHYDADGSYVGSSEQYEDRTVTRTSFHWQPMQGSTPISDEDFYRIAGDAVRAERARRYRRTGALMTVAGGVGLLGGTAIALVGGLAGDRLTPTQSLGMYVGGGVIAAGGGLGFALGFKRLRVDGHPYGLGEAEETLDRYQRGPAPLPQASLPAPAGRTVMLNVVSGRF